LKEREYLKVGEVGGGENASCLSTDVGPIRRRGMIHSFADDTIKQIRQLIEASSQVKMLTIRLYRKKRKRDNSKDSYGQSTLK